MIRSPSLGAHRAPRLTAAAALALASVAPSCLDPTQATLEITTNGECSAVAGTGITAGKDGASIEGDPYDTTTLQCAGAGEIGTIVLLPGDDRNGEFAFKVVTSLGDRPVEECAPPFYGPDCIVARRSMSFLERHPFTVPVPMDLACAGVLCPDDQTCVGGVCTSSAIDCEEPAGCEPDPVIPPPWQKHIGGPGSQMARHVAQTDGVVAVTGNFSEAIDLGAGPVDARGPNDMFVATYSPAGQLRWAKRFGGDGADEGVCVDIGPAGDVYLLGTFEGEVDFGGGPVTSNGETDVALVKLTSFGKFTWAVTFGGVGTDRVGKVATDAAGNVYIVGNFTDTVTIAGAELVAVGEEDAFVASFTAAGKLRWAKSFGGFAYDAATSVAVDGDGHLHVGGSFNGKLELGPTPLVALGGGDIFLASFDGDGALLWAKAFGSTSQDVVIDMAARGDRIVATGSLGSEATFDGELIPAGSSDGFVMSLDPTGKARWTRVFGGAGGPDQGNAVDIAEDGSVLLGGSVLRGPAFTGPLVTAMGTRNPFIASLSPDGKPLWTRQFETSQWGDATGVAASPDGYAYFAGWFAGDLDLGDKEPLAADDAEDMLLLRLAPP